MYPLKLQRSAIAPDTIVAKVATKVHCTIILDEKVADKKLLPGKRKMQIPRWANQAFQSG